MVKYPDNSDNTVKVGIYNIILRDCTLKDLLILIICMKKKTFLKERI